LVYIPSNQQRVQMNISQNKATPSKQEEKKELPRSFSANGSVDPQKHFYVDPRSWNEKNLVPKLENGGFYILLAPSQTGKTTKCRALLEMIATTQTCVPIWYTYLMCSFYRVDIRGVVGDMIGGKQEFFSTFFSHVMNMLTLNKMMKCVGNDDSITIKSTGQGDVVTFHVKSSDDETASEFEVKLVEIEADQLGIPETSYSSVIKMPSAKFKKIIGDMGSMGDTCTITAGKKGVTFSVKGEEISGSTTVKQHASVDKADEAIVIETSEDLSLTFALKYLNIFCKSTTLASSVTLSLSTDSPLMVEYKMKDLGHIRYYLAPKIDEDGVKKEKDD
jgi:proliferating cell nuclear antigen